MWWMFLTGLCFVGVTVTVRYVGSGVPAAEAAFIRYLVGTLLLVPVFLQGYKRFHATGAVQMMLWRGIAHGFGVILWFYAMAHIPIAQVTALGYLTPVVVTVLAVMFLGEVVQMRRILAVVAGFIGVLIIVRPGFAEVSMGQIAQLATTPLFAISFILAKKLSDHVDPLLIVASLSLVCTLTLLPLALVNWVQPDLSEWLLLSLTAVLATLGHYTMTRAFMHAPIGALQPVSFLQLVWATLAGIVLFGEPVDQFVLLGGTILVGSAGYIAHRESVLARQAKAASENDNNTDSETNQR
jgi:drug/metabolite transporter (DMT)-like permease